MISGPEDAPGVRELRQDHEIGPLDGCLADEVEGAFEVVVGVSLADGVLSASHAHLNPRLSKLFDLAFEQLDHAVVRFQE